MDTSTNLPTLSNLNFPINISKIVSDNMVSYRDQSMKQLGVEPNKAKDDLPRPGDVVV